MKIRRTMILLISLLILVIGLLRSQIARADELILNEAGEQITSEDETIFAQGHTAGRLGGIKTGITRSTGGFTA